MSEMSSSSEHPAGRRSCRRIIFEGRVQGVGFRYTAAAAARSCKIRGYIRNRADGTVELLADGHVADIERMLKSLDEHFADNIERRTAEEIALSEPLEGFEIRH